MFVLPPTVARPLVATVPGGRLSLFARMWSRLFPGSWISKLVLQGLKIPFISLPCQMKAPSEFRGDPEQVKAITEEVTSLLAKRAVEEVAEEAPSGFLSKLFVVKKSSGAWRPVLNAKPLNHFVYCPSFKMEGMKDVKDLLRPGDWLTKVDLSDAYLHVPMHPESRQFLQFSWQNKRYQFRAMPFGLSIAPRIFTKVMRVVAQHLRSQGVRLVVYLDDILVLASSREESTRHTALLISTLESLGFLVNGAKSITVPTQEIDFLGFVIDSVAMILKVPREKLLQAKNQASQVLRLFTIGEQISARALAKLIGRLNSLSDAIFPARLHLAGLHQSLNATLQGGSWESTRFLSEEAARDLLWWTQEIEEWNGRAVRLTPHDFVFETDASDRGWGAVFDHLGRTWSTRGFWSSEELDQSINVRELLACFLGTEAFVDCHPGSRFGLQWSGKHILVRSDNRTAVAYINRLGGRVLHLSRLCQRFWKWCVSRNVVVTAEHIAGVTNTRADQLSRWDPDRAADWRLHPELFQALDHLWGPHSIDLFADSRNHHLPRFASWMSDPKATWVDSLLNPWADENGWAYPPFSCIGKVLNKISRERASLTLICPMWPAQPWWPVLPSLLCDFPVLVPRSPESFQALREGAWEAAGTTSWSAIALRLSGDASRVQEFRDRLSSLSSENGLLEEVNRTLMTFVGPGGSSGASAQVAQQTVLQLLSLLTGPPL